ncbi:MAG: PIN domain-containing protein [Thermoplasmata archaeon]
MKRCILDTNAFSILMNDRIPEKWSRIWSEIRVGQRSLILIEPLVSEIYYKNVLRVGKKSAKDMIMWLKSLKKAEIHSLDDNDAMNAGAIKVDYSNYDLSLVDCFLLAIARRYNALILTTDHSIRDAARNMKVEVNFLPHLNKDKI